MTQRPAWLGHFYGGSLGLLNYEILTVQFIPHKDLNRETELMNVKWFDYRRIHPMQATYYFMKCYNDAYRNLYRKAINSDAAPYVRATKALDFTESREKLSFWKLRQLCDQMGVPYDFFLNFAMSWFYRIADEHGKVYPPRPAQILNNEDLIAEAMLAWEERCNVSLQIARDPYFRASNYTGSKNQQAYETFIVNQVRARKVPRFSLHAALYIHDAIRIEEALRQFDKQIVLDAIGEAELQTNVSQC